MSPEDFKRLVSAGLNTDQIALVMEMMERDSKAMRDADEARRMKARDRVAKWRERNGNVSETSPKVTERLMREPAHVEDKTSTSVIEPQEQKASRTQGDVAAFRAGLAPDVSEEVIDEFVKVRRKKRGALTGYAAKLFREDAAKVGMTLEAAARECIRSSWITVKPEYFGNRQRAGPAPPRPHPGLETVDALLEKVDAVTPSETQGNPPYPRLVAFSGG